LIIKKNEMAFDDNLNPEKFYYEGVALLERKYIRNGRYIRRFHRRFYRRRKKEPPVIIRLVAKGISAYLSYESYSNHKSLRLLLNEKAPIDLDKIFKLYFDKCFYFLCYYNDKIPLPHKKKSEKNLIIEHLENEEKYLHESDCLFNKVKKWEKETMAKIKDASIFYQKWVKDKYLTSYRDELNIEGNTDNNQKDEISDTINKDDAKDELFKKGGKPPKIAIDALFKAFEDISKYKKVMELLVSQNFIYPNSYKWKDKKSGYKNRICAFLKDMEGKNYFHKDVVLNYDLCKTIAKNTFNVDIKSNKTFYESTLSPDLEDLIPFSTTID